MTRTLMTAEIGKFNLVETVLFHHLMVAISKEKSKELDSLSDDAIAQFGRYE